MDLQAAFNAAWNGLKAQGWQQANQNGSPALSSHDGARRCSIGHVCMAAIELSPWSEFTTAIRQAHDHAEFPADMEHRMRKVAVRFGLSIPGTEDAAFVAFKAKVLKPVQLAPLANGEWA